jgi:ribulose-5-phosphate 4-epimerase/fuculose-1-phosphate aldolase
LRDEIKNQFDDAISRLNRKALFGRQGDSFSMRIPGANEFFWKCTAEPEMQLLPLDKQAGTPELHSAIYRTRADAGAILLSTTAWSEQLSAIGKAPPTLFDEQARHIGRIAPPVSAGDLDGLINALRKGSNVAIYGAQSLRIGMTRDRILFNAELFEKCTQAYVIALTARRRLRTIPGWVQAIAGRRLRRDQKRAANSFAVGQIPQGMNAY